MVFFTLPAVVLRENTEGGPNDGQIGKGKTRRDNSDKDGPKNAFDLMMSGHPKTQPAPQKSKTLEKLEKQVLNTVGYGLYGTVYTVRYGLICVVHARGNGRSGCLGITFAKRESKGRQRLQRSQAGESMWYASGPID